MPAPSKSGKSRGGASQAQQDGASQTQRTLQTRSQRAGLQVSYATKNLSVMLFRFPHLLHAFLPSYYFKISSK